VVVRSGSKFEISLRNYGIGATRGLTKSSLTYLEDGKVVSGIRFRIMADYFNVPSLFHPLKRVSASIDERTLATKAERKAAEKKRLADIEKATTDKASVARANIKDKVGGVRGAATKTLLFTALMCITRAVADDVVTANRYAVVGPSMLQAVDKEAIGDQVEFDPNLDRQQLAAATESTIDNQNRDVFAGKAMQVLAGNYGSGIDIPGDYKQAFSTETTAQNLKDVLGGGTLGAIACSPLGQVLQGATALALLLTSVFDAGASSGVLAAAKVGAAEAFKYVVSAAAITFIQNQITAFLEDKPLVPSLFAGPLGGNLMAYGAREAANTADRASGGIALSNSQEAAFNQEYRKASDHEFQSKSYFARMFDASDYRSGLGRLIDSTNPSASSNITSFASSLGNLPSFFASSLSKLLPRAAAAESTYDWGFPRFGIPQSVLDDPGMEDPYANADTVASLLDSGSGQTYIDKAKTCFGVSITKGSNGWDSSPANEVNPADAAYTNADCSNMGDKNWKRMMLFIFDTRTMKAAACYDGDVSSCEYSGFGGGTQTEQADTGDPSSLPTGSARDLATKLLPYIKSGKISCNNLVQGKECSDITKTAAGQSIQNRSCYVTALNPQLLAILLSLVERGHTFVLSAICTDHPTNPTSKHHYGRAADFNIIDGTFMGPNDTYWSSAKIAAGEKLDRDIADVAPKSTGFGQQQCHPAFSFLSPFSQFNDTCHHQHIQIN
jgi:hypothetical protein